MAMGSDIFEKIIFEETEPFARPAVIRINCASSDAAREFLQFFYLSKVTLTLENIGDVLRLGKEFNVAACLIAGAAFLKDSLNNDNAEIILRHAHRYNFYDVGVMCDTMISNEAKMEIDSDAPIFKLEPLRFIPIFEYLPLKDLHSFGQTCKMAQEHTGEYFKSFHSNHRVWLRENDITVDCGTPVKGFRKFISNIDVGEHDSFDYIALNSDDLVSLKSIDFRQHKKIHTKDVKSMEKVLNRLENLTLKSRSIAVDFQKVLQVCTSLKRLFVYIETQTERRKRPYEWLNGVYPKLDLLEIVTDDKPQIDKLFSFFNRNPNVRCLSLLSIYLLKNADNFLNANFKLDLLNVNIDEEKDLTSLCSLLNQLFDKGFYQRLHLRKIDLNEKSWVQISTLQGLEKILCEIGDSTLQLTSLKEMIIHNVDYNTDMDRIARVHVNLERVSFRYASYDQLLSFACYSVRLHTLKMYADDADEFNEGKLDLLALNEMREQLEGACKLSIYITDNVYIPTKRSMYQGITSLSHVEIKRYGSISTDFDSWNDF